MLSISIDGNAMAWRAHLRSAMGQDECTDQQIFKRARRWASRNNVPFEEDAYDRYCRTRRSAEPDIAKHVKHYLALKLHLVVDESAPPPVPTAKIVIDFPQGDSEQARRGISVTTRSAAAERNAPRYARHSNGRRT